MIKFKNCTVSQGNNILFQPEWGIYDMAVGKEVVSAFSGPADAISFDMITHVPSSKTIKQKKTAEREELENLYRNVRNIREGKKVEITLKEAFSAVSGNHRNDWLLCIEIAELTYKNNDNEFTDKVINYFRNCKTSPT